MAKRRNKKTNAQVIIEWMEGRLHDDELTAVQWEYFARVKACYKSILKFEARSKTLKLLAKTFEIDPQTAQRIYADTELIYGSVRKHNKDFKRLRAEEMALRAYRRADEKGDPKGMVQATNAYIRASGIELEDSDIPNFEDFEPGDVITVLAPQIAAAIKLQLQAGVVDLNRADYTIDIPHEELPGRTES